MLELLNLKKVKDKHLFLHLVIIEFYLLTYSNKRTNKEKREYMNTGNTSIQHKYIRNRNRAQTSRLYEYM